ncbi:hypothetical protein AAU57_03500 [Nonlabens sp. YIK11]|uniref:TlpA family protein disulfide reductase n=1 Tax=Nonlabens sp. YIK11 TaxID=1453349 RepID=UPI0006DD2014|nr:redoxin family protein [Nonlabens sp. YIK11]KQC32502.1 hypothetical protein AAU57_03500 [Nonlabens sp. YIK11]
MKKFIILPFIALFLLSCEEDSKPYELEISGENIEFVEILYSEDDLLFYEMDRDTIKPNASGKYIVTKNIERPKNSKIIVNGKFKNNIMVPGAKSKLVFRDSAVVFEGTNASGLNLLNEFDRPETHRVGSGIYENDTTLQMTLNKYWSLRDSDLKTVTALEKKDSIDSEFSDLLKTEINYYYAYNIDNIFSQRFYAGKGDDYNEVKKIWDSVERSNPLEADYKSTYWRAYGESIMVNKPFVESIMSGEASMDRYRALFEADEMNDMQYASIKEFPKSKSREQISALFIYNRAERSDNPKSLIRLYDDFKNEYPKSRYLSYLDPNINKVKEYQKALTEKMPSDAIFLENSEIANMDELLSTLKGEKYFVDIWASWCVPCIEEFKHNGKLNALLKEKGYKKIYISIDQQANKNAWETQIKSNQLSGMHMIASKDFSDSFHKNYGEVGSNAVTIPLYMITDESGKIVNKNAPRPSDIENLRKVL